jgi:Tol biopolymer transport system component
MEYVDGKLLTDVIPRDGLPLDKLLAIAIPLADAVAAAHQAGITHRDLKPANVMLTADGRVKVLDFGLAHLREEAAVEAATVTAQLTAEGRILGTAAYMSPEQAEGRSIDSRSDLFSLGIVLFEMVTGQRPFTGDTNMSILSAILKDPPRPISSIRPDVPRELARIIKRALQKDPELRYQTAKDLRNDLQLLKAESDSGDLTLNIADGVHLRPSSRSAGLGVGAAVALLLSAAAAAWWLSGRGGRVTQTQWTPVTDYADAATQPALSQDGRMITFVRGPGIFTTSGDIYVKLLPNGTPVQLTHDSLQKMDPRFSPDGTQIAYTGLDERFNWNTYVVPVFGGREPRLLLSNASGLSWTGDHQYLFSEVKTGRHMAIVTAGEGRADERDIYNPPTREGMAHRSQLSPNGLYVLISEEMDFNNVFPCRVVPADGHDRGVIIGPPDSQCFSGVWSRDGQSVILSLYTSSGTHLWRQRFPKGEPEQLTFGPSEEAGVALDPDGGSIVTSAGANHDTVWLHANDGDRPIVSEGAPSLLRFSPDGARLLFLDGNRASPRMGPSDAPGVLRAYDLQQRRVDTLLGGVQITEYDISRDGKLLAYTLFKEHEPHIWLVPLDGSRPPRQLIADAARAPNFAADGFLYYSRIAEGTVAPWRVALDGSHAVRMGNLDAMIRALSPSGNWRVEFRPESSSVELRSYLRRLSDDKVIELPCGRCSVVWPDNNHVAFVTGGLTMVGKTYVFPSSPGHELPDGTEGMTDVDRFAVERGARVLPHTAVLAPGSDTYAYFEHVAQRNLYRVPLR